MKVIIIEDNQRNRNDNEKKIMYGESNNQRIERK